MKDIQVVGAAIVQDGALFCAQRGGEKSLPFLWEFPGGKIEAGESPQQALIREVWEELGCRVTVGELLGAVSHPYEFGIVHLQVYRCALSEGVPVLTEHADARWLLPADLATLAWAPANGPLVNRLSKMAFRQ